MPSTLTIGFGDAVHTVQLPFGLDILEEAGDAVDRFQEVGAKIAAADKPDGRPPMRLLAAAGRRALEVFCIAINLRTPGAVDYEALAPKVSIQDAGPLIQAMNQALLGSGFKAKDAGAGEPGGAPKAASARPSKSRSAKSSRA